MGVRGQVPIRLEGSVRILEKDEGLETERTGIGKDEAYEQE